MAETKLPDRDRPANHEPEGSVEMNMMTSIKATTTLASVYPHPEHASHRAAWDLAWARYLEAKAEHEVDAGVYWAIDAAYQAELPSRDMIDWKALGAEFTNKDYIAHELNIDEHWERFLGQEGTIWSARDAAAYKAKRRAALDTVQAYRDAWTSHEAKWNWDAVNDRYEASSEKEYHAAWTLVAIPAPDAAALDWKLQYLFDGPDRSEQESLTPFSKAELRQLFADIRRLSTADTCNAAQSLETAVDGTAASLEGVPWDVAEWVRRFKTAGGRIVPDGVAWEIADRKPWERRAARKIIGDVEHDRAKRDAIELYRLSFENEGTDVSPADIAALEHSTKPALWEARGSDDILKELNDEVSRGMDRYLEEWLSEILYIGCSCQIITIDEERRLHVGAPIDGKERARAPRIEGLLNQLKSVEGARDALAEWLS